MCIWCTVSEWNQCLELCSDLPKGKPAVRFLNMNSNIPHQIPPRLSEPNIHFRALCVYCISVWVTILSISKGLLGETCKTILILHVEISEISIKSHHDQPVSSRSFSLGLCVLVNHVTENQLVQTSCPIMLLCEQTLLLPPALLCDLTSSYWWINWNGVSFSSAHPVSAAPSIQMNWDEWTRHSERKKHKPPWRSCREKESLCERFVLNKSQIYWEVRRCEREAVCRVWSDCAACRAALSLRWTPALHTWEVMCSLTTFTTDLTRSEAWYLPVQNSLHLVAKVFYVIVKLIQFYWLKPKESTFKCLWYSDLYLLKYVYVYVYLYIK